MYKYLKDKYGKPWIHTEKIDETRNYHYLMNQKHKKACKYLNYVEHLPILASILTT